MDINEKVAFIKGLAEGMELDTNKGEGKVLAKILDVLTDMADTISSIDEDVDELWDEVDAMSEDLSDVEEFLWDEDDEDEFDDDDDAETFEDGLYEITCPACGEVVCVDEDMLADDNLSCPNCNTKFEIDFSECDCDDCDGCGHEE